MICQTVEELAPIIGTRPACRALGASVATIYRRRCPLEPRAPKPRPMPARSLTEPERQQVLDVLHSERIVDVSPEETWATLLDEGTYLCSTRTMYRILKDRHGRVRERRDQLTHPPYAKPELLASRPNELWSWDIERREAFWSRAVVRDHRGGPVAAGPCKLGAAYPVETDGHGWQAAPTTTERASTVRWSGSGKQDGKVYERNQRLNAPQENPPARTWQIWAGQQRAPALWRGELLGRWVSSAGRPR